MDAGWLASALHLLSQPCQSTLTATIFPKLIRPLMSQFCIDFGTLLWQVMFGSLSKLGRQGSTDLPAFVQGGRQFGDRLSQDCHFHPSALAHPEGAHVVFH